MLDASLEGMQSRPPKFFKESVFTASLFCSGKDLMMRGTNIEVLSDCEEILLLIQKNIKVFLSKSFFYFFALLEVLSYPETSNKHHS